MTVDIEKMKEAFHQKVCELQDLITEEIKRIDPSVEIVEDPWVRKDHIGNDGGGGRTRAFRGDIIENAGVNTSCITGKINPEFASKLQGSGDELWAAGISLIIHPRNPKVPTVHANFRMIQQGDKTWFGGGADLTPYYPHTEDFKHFHDTWKKACKPYGHYEKMKKTCDEYFVNKHRGGEMRGIGGLFFDHHNSGDLDKDFEMVTDMSSYFIESYFPIMNKRVNEKYTEQDEDFQLYRRGRYVEFNLLHDRGTLFGLRTNGRVESILISLPARVRYQYKFAPEPGSPYEEMNQYYWPKDW